VKSSGAAAGFARADAVRRPQRHAVLIVTWGPFTKRGPGRICACTPDVLIEQLAQDEAIAAANTLLLTVPNQLGVEYNAHALESIVKYVAPGVGWR
jgi:hypothetical protein